MNTLDLVRAVFKWLSKETTQLQLLCSVIGLKISRFFSTNKKQNQEPLTREFSHAFSKLQVISRDFGSSRYLCLFGLVGIITLVLVFLQSFENRFINDELKTALSLRAFIKETLRRRENFRQLGMLETFAINDWIVCIGHKCSNKESAILC